MSVSTKTINMAIRPVTVNDQVFATGRLSSEGEAVRLNAVGRGHYGPVIQDAGGLSVATDLTLDPTAEELVTVRGSWDGESIRNAWIADLVDPINVPDHLGKRIDQGILPAGRLAKEELLAPAVLKINEDLGNEKLLFYGTHRLSDGWVGVACATDSQRVKQALDPIIGDALVVVQVDWTARDLDFIDSSFTGNDFADDLLFFGKLMNPAGQFKSCALVRMIKPEMAAALSSAHANALILTSWLQKM